MKHALFPYQFHVTPYNLAEVLSHNDDIDVSDMTRWVECGKIWRATKPNNLVITKDTISYGSPARNSNKIVAIRFDGNVYYDWRNMPFSMPASAIPLTEPKCMRTMYLLSRKKLLVGRKHVQHSLLSEIINIIYDGFYTSKMEIKVKLGTIAVSFRQMMCYLSSRIEAQGKVMVLGSSEHASKTLKCKMVYNKHTVSVFVGSLKDAIHDTLSYAGLEVCRSEKLPEPIGGQTYEQLVEDNPILALPRNDLIRSLIQYPKWKRFPFALNKLYPAISNLLYYNLLNDGAIPSSNMTERELAIANHVMGELPTKHQMTITLRCEDPIIYGWAKGRYLNEVTRINIEDYSHIPHEVPKKPDCYGMVEAWLDEHQ